MDDQKAVDRIKRLVAEEDVLTGPGDPLTECDAQRRAAIETELAQCSDLLRQRRARRRVGGDPEDAEMPRRAVEHYIGDDPLAADRQPVPAASARHRLSARRPRGGRGTTG